MQQFFALLVWVKGHPVDFVQYVILAWGVANVLWAQWPKPKSEWGKKVWIAVHHGLQLMVTTTQALGTFTWPSLIRALFKAWVQAPNPFGDNTAPKPPAS